MISVYDNTESEHFKLNILITDGNNRTSVLKYFRNQQEKDDFLQQVGVING